MVKPKFFKRRTRMAEFEGTPIPESLTVAELIEQLQTFDPQTTVRVYCEDWDGEVYDVTKEEDDGRVCLEWG